MPTKLLNSLLQMIKGLNIHQNCVQSLSSCIAFREIREECKFIVVYCTLESKALKIDYNMSKNVIKFSGGKSVKF